MPAYLGGLRIAHPVSWISPTAIRVRFVSSYGSSKLYQLYAGRTRIATTEIDTARTIIGHLQPSTYPQHLRIIAVDPADRLTNFGPSLPIRPYNRVQLRFATSSFPADAKYLDITAGTTPGGAVSATNRIGRLLFDTDRTYEFQSDPLGPGGSWNFAVTGRDNRPADGNLGTALAMSQAIITHPPDVALDASGNRLSVSIASQQATVSFTP